MLQACTHLGVGEECKVVDCWVKVEKEKGNKELH